ncbi:MAG TPA: TraB/GumN family protein [Thiothrix sp.]|nr:TraB/GumN family protein [Thiothrix sp.]
MKLLLIVFLGLSLNATYGTSFAESQATSAAMTTPETRIKPQVPILWKLETQPAAWLFGTIHIPDPSVNQLPPAAKIIFDQSDYVLTEIPMELSNMTAIAHLMKRTDGKTLKERLPPAIRQRLQHYFNEIGLINGLSVLQDMQIWAVYASLALLEVQIKHPLAKALDANIYETAKKQGKQVGGLETIFEQVNYFKQFSEAEQIELLDDALKVIEYEKITGKSSLDAMITWYREGGKTNLASLMRSISPKNTNKVLEAKLMQLLITQRNKIMAQRIKEKIAQHPDKRLFIAVGAGHLTEQENIPHFLKELGIAATPFQPN